LIPPISPPAMTADIRAALRNRDVTGARRDAAIRDRFEGDSGRIR
jgi:hypothetical protein